ncbi:MAG: hypothetical protein HRT34_06785 [Alcanivorax sp.]|nr:hypothetical protein [Alcanivorax sp.]
MTLEHLLPLIGFVAVMSGTPGPNNLMLMAAGANVGWRPCLPHLLGIAFGCQALLWSLAQGLGGLLAHYLHAFGGTAVGAITDYVFRYLGNRYMLVAEGETEGGDVVELPRVAVAGGSGESAPVSSFVNQADAPSCMDCGSIMTRNGACYKCANCGSTSGCS